MQISNVRLGHATNSSSSHSIVVLAPGETPPLGRESNADGIYGWEPFVLATTYDKMCYLAASVGRILIEKYGLQIATAVMHEWFGISGLDWDDDWAVDHQSQIEFPVDAVTGQISRAFIEDFKMFLQRADVVILGGNDNDGQTFAFETLKTKRKLDPVLDYAGSEEGFKAQKSGQWWTLYNPRTGAKVRMSFFDDAPPLGRASRPELVDFKITDYCPFGCPYCYQDSTGQGKHANRTRVVEYLHVMHRAGVFEIAIGGGEPTLHPDFADFLKISRELGITPNFTTKRLPDQWSTELLHGVKEHAGALAITATGRKDVEKIAAARDLYDLNITVHFVVGAEHSYKLSEVVSECAVREIPLTLLGYKQIGRGREYEPKTQHELTPALLRSAYRLSVDTAFIEQYQDVLMRAAIPDVLMSPGEGRFSMYIDAVTGQAGKSSYHTDSLVPYEPRWNDDMSDIWKVIGDEQTASME